MEIEQNQTVTLPRYLLPLLVVSILLSLLAVVLSILSLARIPDQSTDQKILDEVVQETYEEQEESSQDGLATYTNEDISFSFQYPSDLVADEGGLWTQTGYQKYLNPPENCSICNIPYIVVGSKTTALSLDEYIIEDLALPGETLDDVLQELNIYHFEVDLGDKAFTKITVSDLFDVTAYYTMHDDEVVWFKVYSVYWNVSQTDELALMLATLDFVK